MNKLIRLSVSKYLTYRTCEFQYYLKYEEGVQRDTVSYSLPFGRAAAETVEGVLVAQHSGVSIDAPSLFVARWEKAIDGLKVEYPSTWSPSSLVATGRMLFDQFPAAWEMSGLLPLIDESGRPALERKLVMQLAPNVHMVGKPDVIAINPTSSDIVVVDQKTPAVESPPFFTEASDQLTSYQMLLEGAPNDLGIQRVDRVGFQELVKVRVPTRRGKGKDGKSGPRALLPVTVPARSPERILELKRNLLSVADDIRRGRFRRNQLLAYNTPCALCDYQQYCWNGSKKGLLFKEKRNNELDLTGT